jgi:Aspartyl/Asparaginyl beta-hydroxylase/Sulfotransferase domain
MPPSSPEEIARQHGVAMKLVYDDKMSCSPRQELGEIDLADKVLPTWTTVTKTTTRTPLDDAGVGTAAASVDEEKKEHDNNELMQPSGIFNTELKNPICFTTRGQVDVSKLQEMIREGHDCIHNNVSSSDDDDNEDPPLSPTNYWDTRNAKKYNVDITRPSHDGWGIGKIVLVFSDDFLTRIYQLPWWKDFQPAIQPILDLLEKTTSNAHNGDSNENPSNDNINENPRLVLVRALFASLPPGVTIPIHNDSGEWVKTTHRVHVPILVDDPDKILFRVGPAPHMMQRIDCTPGHVFEINNQAKHAVSNCDPDHSRVHLILDYVMSSSSSSSQSNNANNESPATRSLSPAPIILEPGEKLVQTRRSIDRLKDVRQRPTPSYIILGAQKAGTTSLYDYINQHPWVVRARRRETHCLDWRWNDEIKSPDKQLAYCRKFFFTEELALHPSLLTGDSTPSYLLDSRRVIPRIKSVFSTWKMKFFVMMRDPVRRAASHYAMVTSTDGTPAQLKTRGSEWRTKTLKEVVEMEMKKMDDCGLIPYWQRSTSGTFVGGFVDQKCFDDFAGSTSEQQAWNKYLVNFVPLNTGSYGLLTRGMYAVQLRPWLQAFDRDQFLCLQLEKMKTNGVQSAMEMVWEHLDLPYHPVEDESPKNSREYASMEEDLEDHLQKLFEPHNRILAKVLQSTSDVNDWSNPWPYSDAKDNSSI